MNSTSEVGHAKNIANFNVLISFATSYGAIYNPSRISLKLPALSLLTLDAQTKLAEVIDYNSAFNHAVNERIQEFATLNALATRVMNALEASDAKPEKVKDARYFNRKLQGGGKNSKFAEPVDENNPAPKSISTSQQSYDQKIQHFAGLIGVLQTESSYTPNETDLSIAELIDKKDKLIAKNNAVVNAYTNVSNARVARQQTLYGTDTGLVDIALDVKKYIKSIFGASSPQYLQVRGLQIEKIKG